MPHCDLPLYENILRENCSRERLPRLLLIANRLSEYLDRCVPHRRRCRYLARPDPHTETYALAHALGSIPSHKLRAEYPCVARLGECSDSAAPNVPSAADRGTTVASLPLPAPLLTSLPLPPCPSSATAFNNLAIQFVPPETLTSVDDATLMQPPTAAPAGSHD